MQESKEKNRKQVATLGGLFIVFAIIGIITVIVASVQFTWRLLDNQRQKNMFEDIVHPVVMFDPAPFKSPTEIENSRLLLYSMWATISDEKVREYVRSEENQALLVPASDLDHSAKQLFGNEVSLEHATFSDYETVYFYDEEKNRYEVPTYGFLYTYRPEVQEITKEDDVYKLLIHYIPPDNAWASVYAGLETSVLSNKRMVYVMKEVDGVWNILAVEDPPRDPSDVEGAVAEDFYESLESSQQYEGDIELPQEDDQDEIVAGASSTAPPPVESKPEEQLDTPAEGSEPDEESSQIPEEQPESDEESTADETQTDEKDPESESSEESSQEEIVAAKKE